MESFIDIVLPIITLVAGFFTGKIYTIRKTKIKQKATNRGSGNITQIGGNQITRKL